MKGDIVDDEAIRARAGRGIRAALEARAAADSTSVNKTIGRFAQEANLDPSRVWVWARSAGLPSVPGLIKMAEWLDVPLDKLVGRD